MDYDGRSGLTVGTAATRSWTGRLAVALLAAIALFAFQLARAEAGSAATGVVCPQTGAEHVTADYTGSSLSVSGSGFAALCDVTLTLADPNGATTMATASTDLSGAFTYTQPLSATTGAYTIDADGFGGATLASTNFTVTVGGPTSSLIVKLASGLSSSEQAAVIARDGGTETSAVAPLRLHVVERAGGRRRRDARALPGRRAGRARRARQDARGAAASRPTPATRRSGRCRRSAGTTSSARVAPSGTAKLAVLDTGVSSAGGDLNVGAGWSAFGTDPTTDPNGHGTAVASIAAATADNAQGHRRRQLRERRRSCRSRCSTRAASARTATSSRASSGQPTTAPTSS